MKRLVIPLLAVAGIAPAALADSLVGEDRLLCSAVEIAICDEEGICETSQPWELSVPQFIIFDLKKKVLSTTKASGEDRTSPIISLSRENGQIVVQGVESERAYSAVLNEEDGHITIALAIDGFAISAFGACTPASVR